MIELACPESCSYLIEARSNAVQRETALRRRETAGDPRDLTLSERSLIALDAAERAIVYAQRGLGKPALRDLEDEEILAAVENAIKNLETEESGLIYEHRAASSRAAEVSQRVRDAIDERSKEIPAEARPRRSDVLRALTFVREGVRAHIQRAAGDPEASRSYLRYISLFYAWPQETAGPQIIV